ncbi:Pentatricopeptide repeat-containing protein [Capsicum baccatum]|uniref:Pentatricopeptide repeat-containing protein n=1 Tax=Capsicum baccatum TaxID=33114 RepID=A0A2G2V356_CAPBA|nr:Pentatricopeptide repeat-containing protein [Capsicum baccatum]
MPERSTASWNAMISGYIDSGKIELARSFFEAMDQKNSVSYIVLISGYSKCGDVESAEELFGQLRRKDRLVYNAMIACYAQNSRAKEALRLFNEMLRLDLLPDGMTLASAISACSQLGDLKFGSWIESFIRGTGIQMDDYLATSLIDLYAKCGSIDKAYNLFHGLIKKDLVAYTAMILGCGINGRANDAIELFDEMMNAEINPNIVTITGILTAYSHIGMVEEAYRCFISLQKYGLSPSVDHYAIVVDVLSRAGRLEEAHGLIKGMSNQPHAGVWGALLLGCSLHNNLELGEIAAAHCIELEPDSSGYRSLLANIYASSGRWDDAERLRKDNRLTLSVASDSFSRLCFEIWHKLLDLGYESRYPYSNDSFPIYTEDIDAGPDASPSTAMLSEVAQLLKITIVGGSIPERSGDKLYKICRVFDTDGKPKAKHKKFSELLSCSIMADKSFFIMSFYTKSAANGPN